VMDLETTLTDLGVNFGLGILLWCIALAFPLRKITARPDYAWDLIGLVASTFFALVVIFLTEFAVSNLEATSFVSQWRAAISPVPWWILLPAYLLLSDLSGYLTHRAMHTRQLWAAHAWHHAPKYLNWISGARGAPVHALLLFPPYYLIAMLLPYDAPALIAAAAAGLGIINQHFIHSNIKVPFARHLEWVFITPRAHFVHHSSWQPRTDSNYGFIFSVWDRMLGTWTPPDTVPADEPLGLDYEASNWRMMLGLPARSRDLMKGSGSPTLSSGGQSSA
jgi:sterol desaturase/sphingolipid hydroxylase (fatty acid hydroxylase superfamily)